MIESERTDATGPDASGQEGGAAVALGFASTTDEVIAGQDLTGRTAIVTGASSGLGRETAQ